MGLFSFLRKNSQESAFDDGDAGAGASEGRGRGRKKRGQDSEAIDPVLPEKKRARRRLVGAIALVLAAIIGLPMILDSEPRPLAEDIAIQIPSRDKPANEGSIRQPAITAAPAPSAAPAATAPAKKPAVAGLDKNEEVVETPAAKKPAAPAAVAIKSEPKPQAKPAPKAETKVAAAPKPADDPARANAILDGKLDAGAPKAEPAKASADKKQAKYLLQVAALGSQDKVNELQNKLKSAGLKSHTQKVPTESGMRIRVRVGPFNSKEEAEKARAKLVKLGLNGTLVPA